MADKPHDVIDQYQAFVRESVQAWARQFDPKPEPQADPQADLAGRFFAGLGGYGEWMRSVLEGMPTMPPFAFGPPPGAPPGSDRFDDWARVSHEALSMPAFGVTREQQEEQQALLKAWIDVAEHAGRYQALLQGVHDRASAAMRDRPAPVDPESMRALYDRWVALAEESYAEAALSPAFREVYAALVNAQMRLKLLQQRQIERLSAQAGMPTRKEVDSLGERLQAVRRELRQMQGLVAEVASLKAEVSALRGDRPKAAKKAPGKRSSQ